MEPKPLQPSAHPDPATEHTRVYDRVQRWAAVTDFRIVLRLWPVQPEGAKRALCPACGVVLRDGMLITLNRRTRGFSAGPAQQALAAGDVAALTPELPIESGELWCVVCLPCLHNDPRDPDDVGLSERLHVLVEAALTGGPGPAGARAA